MRIKFLLLEETNLQGIVNFGMYIFYENARKISPPKLVLVHNLFNEYIPVNLIRVKLHSCA